MDKIDSLLINNPVPHTAKRVEGKDKLFATLLLDIRYVLNSIDKQMKGKTGKKPE